MNNVLNIKLPKKRIRIPFGFWISFGVGFWVFFLVLLGYGGGTAFIYSFFFPTEHTKGWAAMEFFFMFLCASAAVTLATVWLRVYFARIIPNPIKIIAVEIINHVPTYGDGGRYEFRGGTIARVIQWLPYIAPPQSFTLLYLKNQKNNFSRFKRSHQIFYLDEEKKIAMAAQMQWSGGAVLLDKDLTHLKLNRKEKRELVASLKKEQEALARDHERLEQIIKAIPEPRPVFRWEKNAAKKKKQLQEK